MKTGNCFKSTFVVIKGSVRFFALLGLLLIASSNTKAQITPEKNVNDRWYYSELGSLGIIFDKTNNYTPRTDNGHQLLLNSTEATATVNNPVSGNLQFYTDGKSVFGKDFNKMPNGTGLIASGYGAQEVAVCPKVDTCGQYYVFTNSDGDALQNYPSRLTASVVDLNVGAQGDATQINIPVFSGVCQSMITVPIPNSGDFWLIGKLAGLNPFGGGPSYYAIKIVDGKINSIPVISGNVTVNQPFDPTDFSTVNFRTHIAEDNYTIVASPIVGANNIKKIAVVTVGGTAMAGLDSAGIIFTLDFNLSTGVFQNATYIDRNHVSSSTSFNYYDSEWSNDGTKLYYSSYKNTNIRQCDFSKALGTGFTDIFGTKGTANYYVGGGLKMGPDGRIYCVVFDPYEDYNTSKSYLATINSPNSSGTACNFVLKSFEAANTITNNGNLFGNEGYFRILPATAPLAGVTADAGPDVSICLGSTVQLNAKKGSSYEWNNAGTLSDAHVSNPFASPTVTTTYTVTVTSCSGLTASDQVVVNVTSPPTTTISASSTLKCKNDLTTITITATGGGTYSWASSPADATLAIQAMNNPVIVNPNITTTYTVTITNGSCISSKSIVITVSDPAINISGNTAIVCSQSTTLTATSTGATGCNYQWTPATGLSSTNTATVTASPTGNTKYTVTTSCDGGCSASKSVTVKVSNVTASITPTNRKITCTNSSATLTATSTGSGCNYSWLPAGGLNTTTGATVIATPSVTTTYTVTTTCATCSPATASVTVTVDKSLAITISSDNPSPCASNPSANITVSGAPAGSTFAWSDDQGTTSYPATNPINVSPTVTTIYTVTVTSPSGCTAIAKDTLTYGQACACNGYCPNTLNGVINNASLKETIFCINSDLHIKGNVQFQNCELKIAEGVTIYVDTATLTLQGCHLYTCGNFLWKGIIMSSSSIVNITANSSGQSTLIEDAYIALATGKQQRQNVKRIQNIKLTVNNAIFNCNYIGIETINLLLPTTSQPISIQNTVFTGRNLPYKAGTANTTGKLNATWVKASVLKAATALTPANSLSSPYNMGGYLQKNLKYYPADTNLKVFAAGVIAYDNISSTSSGLLPNLPIGVQATGAAFNIFDMGSYGIFTVAGSNVISYNNVFQNTIQTADSSAAGIYSNLSNTDAIQVIGNTQGQYNNRFYNCHHAIYAIGTGLVNIQNCSIRSTQTSANPGSTQLPGQFGIYLPNASFNKLNIDKDTVYNVSNGITALLLTTGQVSITGNKIARQSQGTSINNAYLNQAIDIEGKGNALVTNGVNDLINISNNTITQACRGIYATNFVGLPIRVDNNIITLKMDVVIPSRRLPQYGINCSNNQGNNNLVRNNTVTGFSASYPNVSAIYSSMCSNYGVNCNKVSKTYNGIAFDGLNAVTNPNITFSNNSMSDGALLLAAASHQYGFVLDHNAKIMQQGKAGNSSANTWSGKWTTTAQGSAGAGTGSFKTACLNASLATESPLYVSGINGSATNPNLSGYSGGSPNPPDEGFYTTKAALSNRKSLIVTTSSLPTFPGPCDGPIASGAFGIVQGPQLTDLERIALSQIAYGYYPAETGMINKQKLYNMLLADSTILDSSAVLRSFVAQCKHNCIGQLYSISHAIANGNYALAASINNSLDLQHATEINYQTYYSIYLKLKTDTLASDTTLFGAIKPTYKPLSNSDKTTLYNLAASCPFVNGAVVYNARTLYTSIYGNESFEDNCPDYVTNNLRKGNNSRQSSVIKNTVEESFNAIIYPNPSNDGMFNIAPVGKLPLAGLQIEIMDVTGKQVYKVLANVNTGVAAIAIDVRAGIYFMQIINMDTHETIVKKIVINHE